ncbi:MAG: ornithine carbamoyltransferase [Chloroflexi bacterium]|nr:ornithine carbamoyltransferase [Chloroflexota bacterium]
MTRATAHHFLSLTNVNGAEIGEILRRSAQLKAEWAAGRRDPLLAGKTLAMIFQKPSLRTRVSFDVAMLQLGGHALALAPAEVQLGERESPADVARVLSRYVDAIVARVYAHADVVDLARHATVPVINGLSDLEHPCQAIADFLTIQEAKGRLRGIRIGYVGDGNNVAHSLLLAASKLGSSITLASPPGYECQPAVVAEARAAAEQTGSQIALTTDPRLAAQGVDVLYTDVWASMGQEHEREVRRQVFAPYQLNAELVALAAPDVIVMHCLPAHRGEEIADSVIEGPHSAVFDQAENRLHAQKGLLAYLFGVSGGPGIGGMSIGGMSIGR